MTYKSTLQAHNTQLQQSNTKLAQAIEKANALPDASGGSVNVETCTVDINLSKSSGSSATIYHTGVTNGNLELKEEVLSAGATKTLTCAKNSIIATYYNANNGSSLESSGDVTLHLFSGGVSSFNVTGDGTIFVYVEV